MEQRGVPYEVKDESGVLLNGDDRYWIAVGPKVLNPNFPEDKKVLADDFKYQTKIDVVLQKGNKQYYVYCVVGDVKEHTYPNGIYQTSRAFPNGEEFVPGHVDYSMVEFMGKHDIAGLDEYTLVDIIVYDE
jgi:hypothetical protein